jgi:long-chain acyl-CoA synthetase
MLEHGSKVAIIESGKTYTYLDLEEEKLEWLANIKKQGIQTGDVVAIKSDFSFAAIALLLALFENNNVAAMISNNLKKAGNLLKDCEAAFFYENRGNEWLCRALKLSTKKHPLLELLQKREAPGFVVFSSGTTGNPKAVLHDLNQFLVSLRDVTKAYRTLAFLLFDHIAGLDTLFYTLKSGGSLVITDSRTPNAICKLINQTGVEVLPVSPSFINLLYISRDFEQYPIDSVQIVALGSEPVNQTLLERTQAIFPNAKIIQKYGTSEFGSPRTKTRENDPTWLRMDSDFLKIKVVDDILWVKSQTTMLGYLNQEKQPIEDGWYCTGDRVEVDGEWIRIKGRASDTINVGGEKVFPAEVEAIIIEQEWAEDSLVYGEHHPMLGNIVCATIKTNSEKPHAELIKLTRKHCLDRMERYKVPVRVKISDTELVSSRQKKVRKF